MLRTAVRAMAFAAADSAYSNPLGTAGHREILRRQFRPRRIAGLSCRGTPHRPAWPGRCRP